MNIFVLDDNPTTAAKMQADKHVPKMIVESVQMLVQGLLTNGAPANKMPLTKSKQEPHRGGYRAHPCTLWATATLENWLWLFRHTEALCEEYTLRYGKTHYGESQLEHLYSAVRWAEYLPAGQRTPFARALNQSQGRNLDLIDRDKYSDVEAYRTFYVREKARFAKWEKGVQAPSWWPITPCKEVTA
jgi:hypothetical protein